MGRDATPRRQGAGEEVSYHNPAAAHSNNATHYRLGGRLGAVPRLVAPELGAVLPVLAAAKAAVKQQSASESVARKQKFADSAKSDGAKARGVRTKFQKPTARKIQGGKVKVNTSSFWAGWNREGAKVTSVFKGAIESSGLPKDVQKKLLERPLDAMLDLADPVEDRLGAAIDRVIASKGAVQNLFGTPKDVRRVQDIDKKADVSTQNLLKRLRTLDSFLTLFYTQPAALAFEMGVEGFDLVGDAAKAVADMAEKAGKAVGKAASEVQKNIEEGVKTVASWVGLGSLGDGGVVSGPAAAGGLAGVAAAIGIPVELLISAIVSIIVGVIGAAITGGVAIATSGDQVKIEKAKAQAEEAKAKALQPGAAAAASGAGVPIKGPHVEESAASPASAGGGIPTIALVGVAAVAALVLLRK